MPAKGQNKRPRVEKSEEKESSSSSSSDTSVVKMDDDEYQYMYGFGGGHSSEALKGALPKYQNSPKKCNFNLYAEQINGTSFTSPRAKNQFAWFYRIQPSAVHMPFKPAPKENPLLVGDFSQCIADPNQIRWNPFPLPPKEKKVDFVQGLATLMGAGSAETKTGLAIHIYTCNTSMTYKKSFCNADGDMLIVPQLNTLVIRTECGILRVAPWEFAVIQRGIKFSVDLAEDGSPARGYVCEIFTHSHLILPDLGPIGANGLANPRHFAVPVADYIDEKGEFIVIQKYCGQLFSAVHKSCPFDVVAWMGNYVPYKYNLKHYNAINSVTFDHMDPSIFTVLTCQTTEPGVAVVDFVCFPPRWAVQNETFKPPYYHKNCMSEFMGNLAGQYDAKPTGFMPGGGSLHSCMTGHGPDSDTYKKFTTIEDAPTKMPDDSMAFMFESTYVMRLTPYGANQELQQTDYYKCWQGLEHEFDPTVKHYEN